MRPPLRIVAPGPSQVAAHPDAPWTLFFPTDPAVVDAAMATGLDPEMDEWLVTLECVPMADSAALQVRGNDGVGAVSDLRWHGRAGAGCRPAPAYQQRMPWLDDG